jgi:predicted Zn finger-like uncharacterized protein
MNFARAQHHRSWRRRDNTAGMKPYREPTLPIICPDCQRMIYVAGTKLQQNAVGVRCIACRKAIPITLEFLAAIRRL